MVCLLGKVQAKRCQGVDSQSSNVGPAQNPSIAIDIVSSSCSRTVTTVFTGELVELESLIEPLREKTDLTPAVTMLR